MSDKTEKEKLRRKLLEAYYVVSQFAYDRSDYDELQNQSHLLQTIMSGLQSDDIENMRADLVYVQAWVNGHCFEEPPQWVDSWWREPLLFEDVGYHGRLGWVSGRRTSQKYDDMCAKETATIRERVAVRQR
jgi:hypothetical protein